MRKGGHWSEPEHLPNGKAISVWVEHFDKQKYQKEIDQMVALLHVDPIILKRRLLLLSQRAYDQGVQEGKANETWYEEAMEERMKVSDD